MKTTSAKVMVADTLQYDALIDDYIRFNSDLIESQESLKIEKIKSKYLGDKLEFCLLNQKKAKRKILWVSIKHTARDVLIGSFTGFLIAKII